MHGRTRHGALFAPWFLGAFFSACLAESPGEDALLVGAARQALIDAGGLVVFDDVAAAGWSFNGWGWSSSATLNTTLALDAASAKVTMNAAWSGFTLARLNPDFSGNYIAAGAYESVDFDFNPGTSVASALSSLQLSLNNGSAQVNVAAYLDPPLAANTWSHAHVPMSVINTANAPFHRLDWFNNSSASGFSYYVDNVVLRTAPPTPIASGHAPIALGTSTVGGQSCQSIGWSDAAGRPRSADFVVDTYRGGYVRRFTYQLPNGSVRTAQGGVDPSTGYQGFGYLVSHYHTGSNGGSSSADSRDGDYSATLKNNGHSSILWQGDHHLIREYTVELHPVRYGTSSRGTVYGTVHWLIATGRSHPVFSVTLDSTSEGPNVIVADSRAPYGAVAWDGSSGSAAVSGVAWGDHKKFVSDASTTAGVLTVKSDWTYEQTNTIPHAYAWANSTDAEMGMVSTRPYASDVSGEDSGVWFDSSGVIHGSEHINVRCWNKTSLTATVCAAASDGVGAKMPATWAWPYQLVNYGLGASATTNKKIAWGTNYGAVGWQTVASFGNRTYSGHPKTSYATQVVLGRHSDEPVLHEVQQQEGNQSTTLAASVGSIASSGPAGVGRSDTMNYSPLGFDPVYGVWRTIADSNGRLEANIDSGASTLETPIIVLAAALVDDAVVTLDGALLQPGVGYFVSRNGDEVWITLNLALQGSHTLTIDT